MKMTKVQAEALAAFVARIRPEWRPAGILAALMFWQTTPGYLEKNKREQAILKEFKKRAEESAKRK